MGPEGSSYRWSSARPRPRTLDGDARKALAELPGWLQAAGWGPMSASGLLIGAVGGYYTPLTHATIARAMTYAAGVLLAVVAIARGIAVSEVFHYAGGPFNNAVANPRGR